MYMNEVDHLRTIFTSWGVCDNTPTDYCNKCLFPNSPENCSGTIIKGGKVLRIDTDGLPTKVSNIVLNNKTNTLSGNQLLSNLTSLGVLDWPLTGGIPKGITNLTRLNYLRLSDTHLTGEIPKGITNLTGLQEVYLNDNQLTGEIPNSIGNLTGLQVLHLNYNYLTGEIPNSIEKLTRLQTLLLNNNYLTFSTSFLSNLSNLTGLTVSNIDSFSINNNCNKSCSPSKYCTSYSQNRSQLTELKVYGITLNENELIINYANEVRQACAN